jgi:hypothetical protein
MLSYSFIVIFVSSLMVREIIPARIIEAPPIKSA